MVEPQFITAKELATLLKISMRTLWRLRRDREIPEPVTIGKSLRWDINLITNWIATGCPSCSEVG